MDIQYSEKLKIVKNFLKQNDAKLIAHYYVDQDLQKLAEDTGGCVADSLQMAKFGTEQTEKNLIIAGVRFMGETAKILNPEKNIYVLDKDAKLAKAFGAMKTPHVYLFNGDNKLVYTGAIDDNAKSAKKVKNNYLMDAIRSIGSNKKIEISETKALGCSIKY